MTFFELMFKYSYLFLFMFVSFKKVRVLDKKER